MTEAARVRIGLVKMKGGGEFRLLRRAPTNGCIEEARGWLADIAEDHYLPDAVLGIAFRYNADNPGNPQAYSFWHSAHASLPTRLLPSLAERTISAHIEAGYIERKIMHHLGYRPVEPPDDAA